MAVFADIVTFPEPDPDENPWVGDRPPADQLSVVDYDPSWPERFEALAEQIRETLGSAVLEIDHVGSTAVPGLAAKEVIDIDLTLRDPRAEHRYVPPLELLGYRLTVREPSFYEHRMLRLQSPRVNLHVFGPNCPENTRHLLFRDWLREHHEDRARYEAAKRAAVPAGGKVMDYNARKEPVVRNIYERIFRAKGMLAPE